jgi:hypothetical protein
MKKIWWLNLTWCISLNFAIANSVIDNPALLYYNFPSIKPELNQKITIDGTFKSIDDLVARLNKIPGIKATVKDYSRDNNHELPVVIDNGQLVDLINYVANKFGYNWKMDSGVIEFSAIHSIRSANESPASSGLDDSHMISSRKNKSKEANLTSWTISAADKTLQQALSKWCKRAQWQLIWHVNADFPITNTWNVNGNFENAIDQVLVASQSTNLPLAATMYDSNKVLVIHSNSKSTQLDN